MYVRIINKNDDKKDRIFYTIHILIKRGGL